MLHQRIRVFFTNGFFNSGNYLNRLFFLEMKTKIFGNTQKRALASFATHYSTIASEESSSDFEEFENPSYLVLYPIL